MIAEIYHKVSSDSEDELTGNFFGIMRYIPFQRGLKKIFEKYILSEDDKVREILSNIKEDEFDFEFWKKSSLGWGEIDGYLSVGGNGIGIEVKYLSGLSGANQLEREAQMVQEWCKSGEKILIFIAREQEVYQVYLENCHKSCFGEVHLGYLTWQDIMRGIEDIITVNKFEKCMIDDLQDLLIEKGFTAFQGFTDKDLRITGGEFYEFG